MYACDNVHLGIKIQHASTFATKLVLRPQESIAVFRSIDCFLKMAHFYFFERLLSFAINEITEIT